jgi:aryl-alcohol dehydrogenase-like predicted oxidoreductase
MNNFKEPKLSENLKLVERLRAVGARHGRSPGETAIAWTLRHPAVTGAIVGAHHSKQWTASSAQWISGLRRSLARCLS